MSRDISGNISISNVISGMTNVNTNISGDLIKSECWERGMEEED